MQVHVYNLTSQDISVLPSHVPDAKPRVVPPSGDATVNVATSRPRFFSALLLEADFAEVGGARDGKGRRTWEIGPCTLSYGALKGWALVEDGERCPWRIYMRRVSSSFFSRFGLYRSSLSGGLLDEARHGREARYLRVAEARHEDLSEGYRGFQTPV